MKKIIFLMSSVLLGACMTLPTSSECLLRGDGYFKDGNYNKALTAYNQAIARNPSNLEAYASRGTTHFFMGHYELAQQDFEHLLTQNPYYADGYTAYASTLAARGDYEKALQVYNIAIQLKPNKPENFFSRAGVYFMLGRHQEAINDYTAVLNAYPAADVYNARGVVYSHMGQQELAQKDFESAKQPNVPATLSVYSAIK